MMKLFGTDGIRGAVNKDLTMELVFRLGRVFALTIHDKSMMVPGTWSSGEILDYHAMT